MIKKKYSGNAHEYFKNFSNYLLSHKKVHLRKMALCIVKLNERCGVPLRSMKNYSDKIFVEQLWATKFPDYSIYTCVNNAYQDFVTKFLSVTSFVAPIRTFIVKSNTEPCLDIDVLNAIRNGDKHYRKIQTIRQGNWQRQFQVCKAFT